MTLEQQLKQAIADEKESFKRIHATHQGRLDFLRKQLKHVKRNNIRTI
jgi:2-polyprenyl-3-methyl-5-hydroxy-6-metoxy-1,4-benzoquinol methylase